MSKRSFGILIMPAVYFGLIVGAALFVAADLLTEIPAWSLPIFAALAVLSGMMVGNVRLLDVVVMFVAAMLIFPVGALYLVGIAGKLTTTQTLLIIAADAGALGWLMILSPVGAAIVAYLFVAKLLKARPD